MFDNSEYITLPVTILSKKSDQGDYASQEITETFSQKYGGNPNVSNLIIQELAALYKGMNGEFSKTSICTANKSFSAFCDFLIESGGGLESVYNFSTADAGRFFEFCRTSSPNNWERICGSFRSRLGSVVDVIWTRIRCEHKPTEGFSVATTAAMREALKEDIDHIRSKIGRLDRDLKTGRVLNIDLSVSQLSDDTISEFRTAEKADIITTIRHYLPHFPYDKVSIKCNKANANPGQWLLKIIQTRDEHKSKNTYANNIYGLLRKHFKSLTDLYDYYFPTNYDATSILIYWALVTGWNKQVIEMVGSDELNLRFKRNNLMNAWSVDHVIIRGKKTRTGRKRTPTYFTHISDKNDDYGLFNVLCDYFQLTKTIRFGKHPHEGRCIIMAIQLSSNNIGIFGPGVKSSRLSKMYSGRGSAQRFLSKHEIYADADSAIPHVRVETLNWRQLRTSYETILEDMDLPLYARQMLLGHCSLDTTMFPYGSDKHSTKIQFEKIRTVLTEVHKDYSCAKYFHGAFLTPQNDPRSRVDGNQTVVIFARTNWKDNVIMICEDARLPSWPGHEFYVKDGTECNHLAKCLFCDKCLIGKETLPYLAQWDMDIQEYFEEEGDWDSDMKWLELQQAIKEAFEKWSRENDPEDVKWAKATSVCSDFQRIPLDIWHVGDSIHVN
jgi:hypothetical protein